MIQVEKDNWSVWKNIAIIRRLWTMYANKTKIIIILILTFNLVLMVYLIKYKTTSATKGNVAEVGQRINENPDEQITVVFNNKLFPSNYINFEKQYKGFINLDNVYSRLYVLTKYISNFKIEELKSEELIKKYYTDNSDYIKASTTIDNLDSFKKFIKKLSAIPVQNQMTYKTVYFNMQYSNRYEICIIYSNEKKLNFELVINESKKDFKFIF